MGYCILLIKLVLWIKASLICFARCKSFCLLLLFSKVLNLYMFGRLKKYRII